MVLRSSRADSRECAFMKITGYAITVNILTVLSVWYSLRRSSVTVYNDCPLNCPLSAPLSMNSIAISDGEKLCNFSVTMLLARACDIASSTEILKLTRVSVNFSLFCQLLRLECEFFGNSVSFILLPGWSNMFNSSYFYDAAQEKSVAIKSDFVCDSCMYFVTLSHPVLE